MTTTSHELLVSTEWLADNLEGAGRDFVLIDCGEAVAYRARAHPRRGRHPTPLIGRAPRTRGW